MPKLPSDHNAMKSSALRSSPGLATGTTNGVPSPRHSQARMPSVVPSRRDLGIEIVEDDLIHRSLANSQMSGNVSTVSGPSTKSSLAPNSHSASA
jgi:hypothetical protein